MHLPTQFPLKRFLRDGVPVESIEEIWRGFSRRPDDRRMAEAYEASLFGWCLEIWSGTSLTLWFPDEESCDYKGVDFFLLPRHAPKMAGAFQLLELSGKYASVNSAESIGEWVAEKKFKKGDEKVELVISVRDLEIELDLEAIRNAMANSPFLRTAIICSALDSSEKGRRFVGYLQGDSNASAFLDCSAGKLLESAGQCPIFPKQQHA